MRRFILPVFLIWLISSTHGLSGYTTVGASDLSCNINGALNPAACATTLHLPTIRTVSPLTYFPVANGTWDISPWEQEIGHFQYTDWFGTGNTVVGGHSTMPDGTAGIFTRLDKLEPGDPIYIEQTGQITIYIVQRIYVTHERDLTPVYDANRRLTLITCDPPSWNPALGRYEDRVIVEAVRLR